MSARDFVTLAGPVEHAEVIIGSDFLVYADRADTPEAAMGFVAGIRARHPEATHVCFAYRIGDQYRFADDGEPGGTAGQPILRAIEGQGLDHVVCAVVRYFGGTKLGAGGLVRAYGGTAAEALRTAARYHQQPRSRLELRVPFDLTSVVFHLLGDFELQDRQEDYDAAGLVLRLSLLETRVPDLEVALRDATRGRGILKVIGEA
ncbi:putative YigZ family protein [Deinobacterium chartae]|uniref:Putative YigZ family protein n=1 Tax=Deinobacterium chartae TaxID=521158 RepID=A0A841I0Y0_9DEIO|nr:putative YigZ family protein [Deinobacterium chartae]